MEEVAERAAAGIVEEHGDRSEIGAQAREPVLHRARVGHIDDVAFGATYRALEFRQEIGRAREHGDAIARAGELAGEGGAVAGPDAGDRANRGCHTNLSISPYPMMRRFKPALRAVIPGAAEPLAVVVGSHPARDLQ